MSVHSRVVSNRWYFAVLLLANVLLNSATAQGQSDLSEGLYSSPGDLDITDSILLVQDQPPSAQPPAPQPQADQPPQPQPPVVGGPFGFLFAGAFAGNEEPPQLADSPDIFGDSFDRVFGSNFFDNPNWPNPPPYGRHDRHQTQVSGLPAAGLFQRLRISENNKALPVNRVFFHYNHFHNAVRIQRSGIPGGQPGSKFSIDSYVIGVERVFDDGYSSVEVRMPFNSGTNFNTGDFQIDSGNIGNLSIVLKRLIQETESFLAAAGVGISTPTGSNVNANLPLIMSAFSIENQAVHVVPFIGFLSTPNDRLFFQGFLQVDVATNGNSIRISNVDPAIANRGVYNEQTLLMLDAVTGYWLLKNRTGTLTGLAAVAELHYTTALQDTDFVASNDGSIVLLNTLNRFDVLNLTLGIHAQINNMTDVRIGSVIPLRNSQNRFFDSEFLVSVVRRY